jgi:hypothetical protein
MVTNMNMHSAPTEQQHFNACRQYQAYYDNAFRDVGGHVPQLTFGQTVNNYRRECLRAFKRTFLPQNHELYQIQYRGLSPDALPVFEKQLLEACVQHATNPQTLGGLPGEYKQVKARNPYTDRVDAIHFIGHWDAASQSERSFCADPAYGFRPGRVAKIRTPDTHPGWFPKEIPSVWMSGNAKVA